VAPSKATVRPCLTLRYIAPNSKRRLSHIKASTTLRCSNCSRHRARGIEKVGLFLHGIADRVVPFPDRMLRTANEAGSPSQSRDREGQASRARRATPIISPSTGLMLGNVHFADGSPSKGKNRAYARGANGSSQALHGVPSRSNQLRSRPRVGVPFCRALQA